MIVRQTGEMICKVDRDQRLGVRDQKKKDLVEDRTLSFGGAGLDSETVSKGTRERETGRRGCAGREPGASRAIVSDGREGGDCGDKGVFRYESVPTAERRMGHLEATGGLRRPYNDRKSEIKPVVDRPGAKSGN